MQYQDVLFYIVNKVKFYMLSNCIEIVFQLNIWYSNLVVFMRIKYKVIATILSTVISEYLMWI